MLPIVLESLHYCLTCLDAEFAEASWHRSHKSAVTLLLESLLEFCGMGLPGHYVLLVENTEMVSQLVRDLCDIIVSYGFPSIQVLAMELLCLLCG